VRLFMLRVITPYVIKVSIFGEVALLAHFIIDDAIILL